MDEYIKHLHSKLDYIYGYFGFVDEATLDLDELPPAGFEAVEQFHTTGEPDAIYKQLRTALDSGVDLPPTLQAWLYAMAGLRLAEAREKREMAQAILRVGVKKDILRMKQALLDWGKATPLERLNMTHLFELATDCGARAYRAQEAQAISEALEAKAQEYAIWLEFCHFEVHPLPVLNLFSVPPEQQTRFIEVRAQLVTEGWRPNPASDSPTVDDEARFRVSFLAALGGAPGSKKFLDDKIARQNKWLSENPVR